MTATNPLTTRVSDETKEKFDHERNRLGLSTNQFLKLLVLLTFTDDEDIPEDNDELQDYLRGK
jgi:antitoxin component of RelBE/YafQ-DinJ toxin-antitoxin module